MFKKDKLNCVKDLILEASKNHVNLFSYNIEINWNNLFYDVSHQICTKYGNDAEYHNILNTIVTYLQRDLSSYAINLFSEENMKSCISKIDNDDRDVFDKYFLKEINFRISNNFLVSPVEMRLKEILEEKYKIEYPENNYGDDND